MATPEEVESIRKGADLTPLARVIAFEKNLAVIRPVVEVDPLVVDPDSPKHKRALFLWGIEQVLRFQGNDSYYFNVNTANAEFIEDVKKMGCEQVSPAPEYRFKKVL